MKEVKYFCLLFSYSTLIIIVYSGKKIRCKKAFFSGQKLPMAKFPKVPKSTSETKEKMADKMDNSGLRSFQLGVPKLALFFKKKIMGFKEISVICKLT